MKRRTLLQAMLASAVGVPMFASAAKAPHVAVYKSEGCECCEGWVKHLRGNGFTVTATDVSSPSDYREKWGVPNDLGSCHTGVVDGYALEGHVPAADIKRLLAERPKARGLAVPAMPLGSPGMEGARKVPYDVLLVKADGSYTTYKHYN